MLDSLLDVARFDTSALPLRVSLVPLPQIERWLHDEFTEQFLMKGLRLRLRFPRRHWLLRTDETHIKVILRNLLVNALKYTDRGGALVAVRICGTTCRFRVWDTGIGIADHHLPQVFDEFFQVGNAERDSAKGMGLGLSIVKREAQRLGGAVACRSRVGKGSVFELALPRKQLHESLEPRAVPAVAPDGIRGVRVADRSVCLVEDAPSVREALTLLLASWGMAVTAFADASAALDAPALRQADFVITDLRLPGPLSGIDLLREMQRQGIKPLRSVVLTGEINVPEPSDPAGWPWPILHKPCDPGVLWAALTG